MKPGDKLDLGSDVELELTGLYGEPEDFVAGGVLRHLKPDGSWCAGGITWDKPECSRLTGAKWQIESWEPLTASPSFLCHCGFHGFIREGKWVPA